MPIVGTQGKFGLAANVILAKVTQVPHDTLESRSTKVAGVVSWALLYCECRFNLTTTIIMFVVILKQKSHSQLSCTV